MPTNGRVLLDTNMVIALLKGEPSVVQSIAETEEVFVPAVVAGELLFGARKSGKPAHNLKVVDDFLSARTVLNVALPAAAAYGQIKADLRAKGTPIPENDLWIAAIAIQHDLVLATRDKHFAAVDGLKTAKF